MKDRDNLILGELTATMIASAKAGAVNCLSIFVLLSSLPDQARRGYATFITTSADMRSLVIRCWRRAVDLFADVAMHANSLGRAKSYPRVSDCSKRPDETAIRRIGQKLFYDTHWFAVACLDLFTLTNSHLRLLQSR